MMKGICAFLVVVLSVTWFTGMAQLTMEHEPHHKILFKNNYIRIISGHVPVHDSTLPHIHAANSVVIFLSPALFDIQVLSEKAVTSSVKPGDTRYVAYGEKPVEHIVFNRGNTPFDFQVVELLQPPAANSNCPLPDKGFFKLLNQQKQVDLYQLSYPGAKNFYQPAIDCPSLLVAITGNIVIVNCGKTTILQRGGFALLPPKSPVIVRSTDHSRVQCILLHLHAGTGMHT